MTLKNDLARRLDSFAMLLAALVILATFGAYFE